KSFEISPDGWIRTDYIQDSWKVSEPWEPSVVQMRVNLSPEFGYQNLYLTGNARIDGQTVWADTFSIQLMDTKAGGWLGQKSGDQQVVTEVLTEFPALAEGDEVSYEFGQYSREDRLPGIQSVKIRLISVQ